MKPVSFEHEKAKDIGAALDLLAEADGDAKLIAGGQSLGPMLNLRLVRPTLLIDIRQTEGLAEVESDGDHVFYGASVTHSDIEDGLVADAANGMMRYVAAGIAHRAIRNRGTIGGSLNHADPAADWLNALIALGATVRLRSRRKERTEPLASFILGAFTTTLGEGEMMVGIVVPRLSKSAGWGYYKFCRKVGEFSEATGVAIVDPDRLVSRVVMGAAGGRPVFLKKTARALAREGPASAIAICGDEIAAATADLDRVDRQLHVTAVKRAIKQACVE